MKLPKPPLAKLGDIILVDNTGGEFWESVEEWGKVAFQITVTAVNLLFVDNGGYMWQYRVDFDDSYVYISEESIVSNLTTKDWFKSFIDIKSN